MSTPTGRLFITIDGSSSSGKSTFAKTIAKELGLTYIDSGAMYRAVTLFALRNGMAGTGSVDEEALTGALDRIHIDFRFNPQKQKHETFLNGENIEDEIRTIEVSDCVSPVSKIGKVREKLVAIQRSFGKDRGVVMDGRDIGTVVFPGADIKIFLASDVDTRARRRHRELLEKGQEHGLEEIKKNISDRDRIDSTREISPLRKPDDAVELDNSSMTVEEEMEWFRNIMEEKLKD